MPTTGARRNLEVEVVEKKLRVIAFRKFFRPDDHLAEPRPRGNGDPGFFDLFLAFLGEELLVPFDSGLALGVAALRAHAYPLELAREGAGSFGIALLLLLESLFLLIEPARVVALPGDALAPVQFENPARHVVEGNICRG